METPTLEDKLGLFRTLFSRLMSSSDGKDV